MRPDKPLPFSDDFVSVDDYVETLLHYVQTTDVFRILCGGIHILDFFASDPGLFHSAIPAEWRPFLAACPPMDLLDFLMRDDLDKVSAKQDAVVPPESLVRYVKDIRRLSLRRDFVPAKNKAAVLPRNVALGMNAKKIHEVSNFAGYVDELTETLANTYGEGITHLVDFGSGQNYLGRALASPPYNQHIVAVEGREINISGAKKLDILSGLVEPEKVMRNKKVFMAMRDKEIPIEKMGAKSRRRAEKNIMLPPEVVEAADLRPKSELATDYTPEEGKGSIHYVEGHLESGDLSEIISNVRTTVAAPEEKHLSLMAISIHSCGNLSHYGIRSLVMNPSIRSVAIVGCCYNLLTEKLGPPTYKLPYMRPTMQPVNGRVFREEERRDPQGFPLSGRLSEYQGGVRMNITARMMACQAPQNWTINDSDRFFTRHYYRAVLQSLFLEKGVVSRVYFDGKDRHGQENEWEEGNTSTNPVIIGSLRKQCYKSFVAYVRGAIEKLTTNADYTQYSDIIKEKLGDITDEEIVAYEQHFAPRKSELSSVWSLIAFSCGVVESLIATDRWLFLKEHPDIVRDCWVETVFDYRESPRNLVVVGIKK